MENRFSQLEETALCDIPVSCGTLEVTSYLKVVSPVFHTMIRLIVLGQSIMKKALGQGISADELKLPTITSISSSSTRSKDWEDVLTAHSDDNSARTWRVLDQRIGAWSLEVELGAIQVSLFAICEERI